MSTSSMRKAHNVKKIGFYDSGLGGLFLMRHVQTMFPGYEYVFLGDEKNLPYGPRPVEELFTFARASIDFLFEKENCDVVVIACNTLSATVYETLAGEYHIKHPDKLLFDVITPTIDALPEDRHYSVFGTLRTIESHLYRDGLQMKYPEAKVGEYIAHELALLIEEKTDPTEYISSFKDQVYPHPHTIVLSCTHYGLVFDIFKKVYPDATEIVCQHTIMTDLFRFILHAGGEVTGPVRILVTKENPVFTQYTNEWFPNISIEIITLSS